MTDAQGSLYCFGLGYSALALARRMSQLGWTVGGSVRSAEKARRLCAEGIAADVFDGTGRIEAPSASHWLVSIPPVETGCPAALNLAGDVPDGVQLIYLSTTGVYGDLKGGWAFEWLDTAPANARSERRVLAETQWREMAGETILLRLPGIYGPARSAFSKLRDGTARSILKPGQVFSRIHVDDIVSALEAILAVRPEPGAYNLADDLPAPPQDVNAFAAELLGLPPPPEVDFDKADLSPMAASFYEECKRVPNSKLKAATGWRPLFPTYREGLAAVLEVETIA